MVEVMLCFILVFVTATRNGSALMCKHRFILQPQYTDNPKKHLHVRESLQIHFKVAERNSPDFIQAGDSHTDVSGHYQHTG